MGWPAHPFKTPPLSGQDAGWWRPLFAVLIGLGLPSFLTIHIILAGGPVATTTPGSTTPADWRDHLGLVIGLLAVSPLVSWVFIPLAVPALRAALMLGWAGWGTAMAVAVVLGMPIVHLTLNGDLTTDQGAVPGHLGAAIAIQGLVVWASYWALFALRRGARAKKNTSA